MSAAVPLLAGGADQSQPGFVHEGGGLQRVAGRFTGHLLGSELSEFLINQRKQLVSGLGIALVNRFEDMRGLADRLDNTIFCPPTPAIWRTW